MIGSGQVVIDGFRQADYSKVMALLSGCLSQAMARIRRVVSTGVEHIANVVTPQQRKNALHVAILKLVAAGTECSGGSAQQTRPEACRLSPQINQLFFKQPFNAIVHAINLTNACIRVSRFKGPYQTRIDDSRGSARLPNEHIPLLCW